MVIEITLDEQYYEYFNSENYTFIDYYAPWCGPCKSISPNIDQLSDNNPHIIFLKINIDNFEEISDERNIQSLPTFEIIQNGILIGSTKGANKTKINELIALVPINYSENNSINSDSDSENNSINSNSENNSINNNGENNSINSV